VSAGVDFRIPRQRGVAIYSRRIVTSRCRDAVDNFCRILLETPLHDELEGSISHMAEFNNAVGPGVLPFDALRIDHEEICQRPSDVFESYRIIKIQVLPVTPGLRFSILLKEGRTCIEESLWYKV